MSSLKLGADAGDRLIVDITGRPDERDAGRIVTLVRIRAQREPASVVDAMLSIATNKAVSRIARRGSVIAVRQLTSRASPPGN